MPLISLPHTSINHHLAALLLRNGFITSIMRGDPIRPNPQEFDKLPPQNKRMWLELKYRSGLPVINAAQVRSCVSFTCSTMLIDNSACFETIESKVHRANGFAALDERPDDQSGAGLDPGGSEHVENRRASVWAA